MKAILLFLVIATLSQAHGIDQKEKAKSNQQSSNSNASAAQKDSTTNPTCCCKYTENKDNSKKNDEGRAKPSYWQKVISPDVLPNWILVGVGFLAAVIGIITLVYIHKSAKALINSERAWLDGQIIKSTDKIGIVRHSLKITNHGKTVAQIIGCIIEPSFFPKDERHNTPIKIEPFRALLGSDKSEKFGEEINLEKMFTENGTIGVKIKYIDVFSGGDTSKDVHETSFVYHYAALPPSLVRIPADNKYS
jgi:hypothetical protein